MNETQYPCTIAFDFKQMRPGCAVVQRTLGATIGNDQLTRFDAGSWVSAPTPDMQLAALNSQDEMDQAISMCETLLHLRKGK